VPELDVDAILRGGRRYRHRHAVYRGVASLAAVAVAGAVLVAGAQLVRHPVSLPATTSTAPVPSVTAAGPVCTAADLTAARTSGGGEMSQPFAIITLTNASAHACELSGYPAITSARGNSLQSTGVDAGMPRDVPISVIDGSIYEVADPGPTRFTLDPGGNAWFALGTATAYDGPAVLLGQVSVALDGASTSVPGELAISVSQSVAAATGEAFGITVTAYAPGTFTKG
jgi:hypothetical protein